MKRFVAVFTVLLIGLCSLAAAQNRTYTIEDLLKVRRVADPQVSPDGRHVAFTIGDVNFDANKVVNQIYVVQIDGTGLKHLRSRGSDVLVFHVLDTHELTFPFERPVRFKDLEDAFLLADEVGAEVVLARDARPRFGYAMGLAITPDD